MSFVNDLSLYVGVPLLLGCAVFIIGYAGRKLAGRYSSDLRIVWYLFSLTMTVTLLIAWWATSVGAIDATGSFRGAAGNVLLKLLKSTLDLGSAFVVYGGVVALVVFPQLASWVLSGLHGCASAPIFIGPSFRFLFWSIVKSLVIAAGVIFPTGVYGWIVSWDGMNAMQAMVHACIALISLVLAFAMLYVYRDVDEALAPTSNPSPSAASVRRFIRCVNAWMNRRISSPDAPSPQEYCYTMRASFLTPPVGEVGRWKFSAEYTWPKPR